MNVAVKDRLPGNLPAIHSNIEALYRFIAFKQLLAPNANKVVHSLALGLCSLKPIGDMALGNNKTVSRCNRVRIQLGKSVLVFKDVFCILFISAKRAVRMAVIYTLQGASTFR